MLISGLINRAQQHPYYHLWNRRGEEYLRRWWVFGQGTDRDRDDRLPGAPYINQRRGPLAHWLARHFCVRVHQMMRSDSDRHLHDHPAWNISVVLTGGFYEVMPCRDGSKYPFHDLLAHPARHGIREEDMYVAEPSRAIWRGAGRIVFRLARMRHKIVLPIGQRTFTLFVLGKKSNEWAFYVAGARIPWREYDSQHSAPRGIQ